MNPEKYHIKFLNLAHRTDRYDKMVVELDRAGIKAERHPAKLPRDVDSNNPKYYKMLKRTPGAIGCHIGQCEIMQEALMFGKHAVVFEDDLHFCQDFQERFAYIENWMETHEWDIFYLGSSVHVNPPWWHKRGHRPRELESCNCTLNRDAECTDDPRILRCYGIFATFAYVVRKDSIQKVLDALEGMVHESIGIDFAMIALGTKLKQFCFVPGPVRQITNQSDIGTGITNWDGFLQLNGTRENSSYVFQERMGDFDPLTFNWNECKIS